VNQAVVALLVSHDGARWLPAVIDGLRSQTAPICGVVAVDTGSHDESPDLLLDGFDEVATLPGRAAYPEAVRTGLEQLPASGPGAPEWIWLLHDDSNPAPEALERLLAAAADDPTADILGPKLREWPSLRRLLEVGVTISGTGRRETGLEPGEYDQGQHDEVREVLAVNTAGMLVRRSVLEELGGLDDNLPIFGNDVDFGWRAAARGHRTVVVPDAVVFHAEAAHRGTRRTPLTGRHTHYQERRAALFTLLANVPARRLPWQVVRLVFGTLLRMVGFFVVRSPGEALDDLAALFSVCLSPREVGRARQARRVPPDHTGSTADPDRLLAPWWLPYRHGLDFVGDIVNAAFNQAQDVADRRRAAKEAVAPVPIRRPTMVDDDDAPEEDTGLVARFFTNPLALALTLVVALSLFGAREAFGQVTGGGLAPAPAQATHLLRLWGESWHALGTGTAVPAPAYVVVMGVLGWVLGNSGAAAVSAVLLLAVPLGIWGAWRMLRVVGRLVDPGGSPRWLVALGAVTYALVPVTSGAFGDGRLGVVAVGVVLPFLAHAALGFADPERDRRWRAAWRTGLLLTLAAAFEPVAWVFALVLTLVLLGFATAVTRRLAHGRDVLCPPLVALAVAPVLLLPWWLPAIQHGASSLLLMETGRQPYPSLTYGDFLLGRFGSGDGGPWWLGALLLVLAALALVPRATRVPVLATWLVAAVAAITATGLSLVPLPLPGGSVRPGIAMMTVVLHGCFVLAALLGAQGLITILRRSRREHHEVLLVGLAVVAAIIPAFGLGWFVWEGPGDLANSEQTGIPPFMTDEAAADPAAGILVVRGDVANGLTYAVRRGAGDTLGENEILYASDPDPRFDADVRALVSRPTPAVVDSLAEAGIRYLVLPAPYDGSVAAGLDATDGLGQAGSESQATRTWRVDKPVDPDAVDGPHSILRPVLLVVEGVGLVVVLVLSLPTLRVRRRTEENS
jgi:GT2 family glycosyltransferase